MSLNKVLISDPSLRDGNHAVAHQITKEQIATYCLDADDAGVPIIEVGHGNGNGASSIQVGLSLIDDITMLETARKNITKGKLGIHIIPGFATIERDLKTAIDIGVDVIRIASHCTEADITQRHIEYVRSKGKEAYGVLMMSHLATPEVLLEEAQKMEIYGAEGIIIMDSAGFYIPSEVSQRIKLLVDFLKIPVGFHAHNNLGLAIANSLAAFFSGAKILDASIRGFGAGAGNAQLEVLIAVLEKLNVSTGVNLYKILDTADKAQEYLIPKLPTINSESIVSGLAGIFSAFAKHVNRISKEYHVNPRDVYFELGRRKVVGGQEDLIYEVALDLSKQQKN